MKKLTIFTVFVLLVSVLLLVNCFGMSEPMPLVMDEANILLDTEASRLQSRLSELSERAECHVIVLTVEGVGSNDAWNYAKNYFNSCGYGWGDDRSGILLLLSMEYRDYAVYTYGKAYDKFDGSALDKLDDAMLPYFGENDFYNGFIAYADTVEDTLVYHFDVLKNLLIAAVVGVIVSFIALSVMKGKLKSVRPKNSASDYVRDGSFKLTRDSDIYLYRNISRTRRANNSSSSSSSHGGSRSSGGGRSGKF